MTVSSEIPNRPFAGVFDLPTSGPSKEHGVDPGSDYIGGYGGVGWYQYYIDSQTGETYSVRCTDGVNGGRGPYSESDQQWRHRCYWAIIQRSRREATSGKSEIRISRNERAIMQDVTHRFWLESGPDKRDGVQSEEGLNGGFVGHCYGVPVICDLEKEDVFPPKIGEEAVKQALTFATQVRHMHGKEGEVFIGDFETPIIRSDFQWKTLRLGPSVRDSRGRLTNDRRVPLFIQKTELDEAVEALRKWEEHNK